MKPITEEMNRTMGEPIILEYEIEYDCFMSLVFTYPGGIGQSVKVMYKLVAIYDCS